MALVLGRPVLAAGSFRGGAIQARGHPAAGVMTPASTARLRTPARGPRANGAPLSRHEHVDEGVGEDLRAEDDVRIARVLGPVVTNTADRRHEHHGRGKLAGQPLRVVAGARGPAAVLARRAPL